MCPNPDIDMIGAQDLEEDMQLHIGYGHVIYTGGAKGTDELAEDMAKHYFGMQVEVVVPPKNMQITMLLLSSRSRNSFLVLFFF